MKALALVEAPDHVCCRYRIRAFAPALAGAGWSMHLEGLAKGALGRLGQLGRAAGYEAVLLQRKLLPGWQLGLLRRRARHLVFDFDDAVLYRDSYDPRGPHSRRRAARFARTVRAADVVIAGNDFLADCALRAGARPDQVRVIPTCLELGRYGNSPPVPSRSGPGLTLVWVGSSSTMQGLERRRDLWDRVAREVPGVRLRVIADRAPELGALPVEFVAWDAGAEAAAIAAGDVGISWIPDDLWSRGKCGLKVLQYQAAGLPVVANPVGVHPELIRPGTSGFLATTNDDWVAALRALADDPELRLRLGASARAAVAEGYSVAAWSTTFVASLPEAPPPHSAPRRDPARAVAGPGPKGEGSRAAGSANRNF